MGKTRNQEDSSFHERPFASTCGWYHLLFAANERKKRKWEEGKEMTREPDQRINDLAHEVIAAAMRVSNVLGAGFLEKVYERALVKELLSRGIVATSQAPIQVLYNGESIGDFFADVLVENCLIVELKCVDRLSSEHLAQCINYLTATGHPLALLINFQHPRLEWKRVVLTND